MHSIIQAAKSTLCHLERNSTTSGTLVKQDNSFSVPISFLVTIVLPFLTLVYLELARNPAPALHAPITIINFNNPIRSSSQKAKDKPTKPIRNSKTQCVAGKVEMLSTSSPSDLKFCVNNASCCSDKQYLQIENQVAPKKMQVHAMQYKVGKLEITSTYQSDTSVQVLDKVPQSCHIEKFETLEIVTGKVEVLSTDQASDSGKLQICFPETETRTAAVQQTKSLQLTIQREECLVKLVEKTLAHFKVYPAFTKEFRGLLPKLEQFASACNTFEVES
ncbi:hypothetical protein INT43_006114 [Umbelopsis isabellina]|uniref:Uncharacterized protein n=1 Tax=Mortierella isabellina TaxID=91625 RepID=A0A8H7PJD4_MORIS|nr:hypothetical protein INT43_006114 [Umbelopsis isabellina]